MTVCSRWAVGSKPFCAPIFWHRFIEYIMIHSSAPTGIFFRHPPQNFLGCQIQWKSNGRMLVSTGNPKNIGFLSLPGLGGILSSFLCYISINQNMPFLEGGSHRNTHPLPRTAAPNTENHPKQLFSRGSVKKVCHTVGCRSNGYFCGICCKNVRRIFLEGGSHRITPHTPSSHPRKVGEMWVFGAQGRKTGHPGRWPVVYLTEKNKTSEGLRKMFWVPKIVYFYLIQ